MRSTLSPGDNIVELKDYSHVYIFPAPGVETITVTPEDDCMKFVDDTIRGKKYYDVYASSKLQEKYTVTTSGGSAQLPTATVRLAPGSKARVLEKNERTLEYVPYKELAEGRQRRGTHDGIGACSRHRSVLLSLRRRELCA